MRSKLRYVLPLVAASTLGSILAPIASADTELITPQQSCDQVAGSSVIGGTTTECNSPGNVQLNATPEITAYPYPWADEFYGPALMIGGPGYGPGPAPAPMPAPAPHGGGGGR